MTYYADNKKYEIEEAPKTKYPRRFFYKRRYKKGDHVIILCNEVLGHKTVCGQNVEGLTGYIYEKRPGRKYAVMLDNILFNGREIGFELKAKGLKYCKWKTKF